MKKKIKTEIIISLFRFIKDAKIGKMSDADKIKMWKIMRALKPVAEKFDDDIKTSSEKLRPEGYAELLKNAQKIENEERKEFGETNTREREQEFAKLLREKDPEYAKFQDAHVEMMRLCNEALKEFAEKEVKVEYELLDEDGFGKLMASNDWTLEQAAFISDYICE